MGGSCSLGHACVVASYKPCACAAGSHGIGVAFAALWRGVRLLLLTGCSALGVVGGLLHLTLGRLGCTNAACSCVPALLPLRGQLR